VRGVSWFAPVMTALYDLDGYDDAERVRKRIEACLSAFITSEEVDGNTPALGSQSTDSNGATNEEFRPGMIVRLRNGEAVTVAEPKSSGGYGDYVRVQQRVIAAGMGMPYEV
jgi:capsid protein